MRVVPSLQTARPLLLQAWTTTFLQVLWKSWVKPGANAPAWLSQAAMADAHAFLHSLLEAAQPDDTVSARSGTTITATTARLDAIRYARMVRPSSGAVWSTGKRGCNLPIRTSVKSQRLPCRNARVWTGWNVAPSHAKCQPANRAQPALTTLHAAQARSGIRINAYF